MDITHDMDQLQAHWVFGQLTTPLRQQVMAFWLREGALTSHDEAWRRSWEVAAVLQRASTGDMAGICTVAVSLDEHGHSCGVVRVFNGAVYRRSGVATRLVKCAIAGFQALAHEAGAPQRLVATIENPKLGRPSGQRLLATVGLRPIGRTPQGQLLVERWLVD